MTYSDEFRSKMWNEFDKCEHELFTLKSFVQNPMTITNEMLIDFMEQKEKLVEHLRIITNALNKENNNKRYN